MVARFAPIEQSRASSNSWLAAVAEGEIDGREGELWLDIHGLAEAEPGWAVELLHAYLVKRPAALRLGTDGKDRRSGLE